MQLLLLNNTIQASHYIYTIVPIVVTAYLLNSPTHFNKKTITKSIVSMPYLSKRENELLHFISQGYNNKEIAEQLFISQNTVKTHIKNILSKLDLRNRTQIAQWYYQNMTNTNG